ncbi:MAG: nucleotide exchange factor GrpE [Eubacteriales bacterium]|nr:nucleotide exchange factor GrpE [Eubacteriales bacterium]
MEEKTVEEMLQEEIPVTEETSGEENAGAEAAAESEAATDDDCMDADQEESGEPAEAEDPEEEEPGETPEEEGTEEGKKGFFSKLKKGDKEKAAMKEKIAGLEDRVMRQMAEFDNYRKRTDKEKQQMFSMGERNVIEKMLPIIDNFERGLAAIPEEEKNGPLASGMEMIYRQLTKQLEDLGVTPIEAVGQEFDPNFHNAVMQVESAEYPSGTVAQEFQKGYKYHDTVVRHSMVGVAQ